MKALVAILFLALSASAQVTPHATRFMKTDLVSYLPGFRFNTGNANAEVEFAIAERLTIACDAGVIYSYGRTRSQGWFFLNIDQRNTRGFLAGMELKLYTGRRKVIEPLCLLIWPLVFQLNNTGGQYSGLYTSLHLAVEHTRSDVDMSGDQRIFNPHVVSRIDPMLLFRIGFQSVSPRNIVVDQSFGAGVHYPMAWSDTDFDTKFISVHYPSRMLGVYPMINYSLKVGLPF